MEIFFCTYILHTYTETQVCMSNLPHIPVCYTLLLTCVSLELLNTIQDKMCLALGSQKIIKVAYLFVYEPIE